MERSELYMIDKTIIVLQSNKIVWMISIVFRDKKNATITSVA